MKTTKTTGAGMAPAPSHADLLQQLASTAKAVRTARQTGVAIPILCANGCPTARFWRYGPYLRCLTCGGYPRPADALHTLLLRLLGAQDACIEEAA